MGIDCIVKIDEDYHSLDRWHCFEEEFVHGQTVTLAEARYKLHSLSLEDAELHYHSFWRGFIAGLLSNKTEETKITFYNDYNSGYPKEYWEKAHPSLAKYIK